MAQKERLGCKSQRTVRVVEVSYIFIFDSDSIEYREGEYAVHREPSQINKLSNLVHKALWRVVLSHTSDSQRTPVQPEI